MDTEHKTMNTKELTEAVGMLLEREELREAQRERRRRRRARNRREQMESDFQTITRSVQVIQWCVVGICTVMTILGIIVTLVIWQIGSEAERIKGEIQTVTSDIQREAEAIRDKLSNPMRTIGGSIGSRLDRELGSMIKGDGEE